MLGVDRCRSVNVGGMRVPYDHVLVELSLPAVGEGVDGGGAVLTAAEEEILGRGIRRPDGTVVLRLDLTSRGRGVDTRVSLAELKRVTNLSVKACVFKDSTGWMERPILERLSVPGYDSTRLIVAGIPFAAKRVRGVDGRRRSEIHPAWDTAKEHPDTARVLLDGISPGTSKRADKSGGIGRANARQLAWLLTGEAVVHELGEVLDYAELYEHSARILDQIREQGPDGYVNEERSYDRIEYDEHVHNTYESAGIALDVVLRFVRGVADLARHEPTAFERFMATRPDLFLRLFETSEWHAGQATPIAQALTMGYITAEQSALLHAARARLRDDLGARPDLRLP
jgi:hypothetical protein